MQRLRRPVWRLGAARKDSAEIRRRSASPFPRRGRRRRSREGEAAIGSNQGLFCKYDPNIYIKPPESDRD
ncbi:hypothetical protein C2845_PM12G01930 [Panicum miliaceum]|uniref:Uncharacterized protein n=1 Tax=Panicum miliaceum TaxID=4540 RepID=A0A3L6QI49_PANMI|nr:hypothetical protein C2845_PM12G01930 [Panicum miliaceum]